MTDIKKEVNYIDIQVLKCCANCQRVIEKSKYIRYCPIILDSTNLVSICDKYLSF